MIADSSAWIELLRATGSPVDLRLRSALRQDELVLMPDVVYQEILQGARDARHFMRLQSQLDVVPAYVPDDSRETSAQAAALYARCRWNGLTICSPNDCLIAVSAIQANVPLLHADLDFEAIGRVEPRLRLLL